jgi:hypothetical protein
MAMQYAVAAPPVKNELNSCSSGGNGSDEPTVASWGGKPLIAVEEGSTMLTRVVDIHKNIQVIISPVDSQKYLTFQFSLLSKVHFTI